MNLLTIEADLYCSYKDLGVNECYSDIEHVKNVIDKFPQHEDEITVIYKTRDYCDYTCSRMVYKIYGHNTDVEYVTLESNNHEDEGPIDPMTMSQWDFYLYSSRHELDRSLIEIIIRDTELMFGYNKHNVLIMYDIIGIELLDRLYEHDIELLEILGGGFTIRDDVNYGIDSISTINKYPNCFSDKLRRRLIEEGYMDEAYITEGSQFDVYNDHQLDILAKIHVELDIVLYTLPGDIYNEFLYRKYKMRLPEYLTVPIHELMYYMDCDNITIPNSISNIEASYVGDIIKFSKRYRIGALRLWYRFHDNATVVHAYTTYLPNIVLNSKVLIHPKYIMFMKTSKYSHDIGLSDIIIRTMD